MQRSYLFTNESIAGSHSDGIVDQAFNRSLDRMISDFPVLRSLWNRHRAQAPLRGARIGMLCPATVQFAALATLLIGLGARVRYAAESTGETDVALRDAASPIFANERDLLVAGCDDVGAVLDWPDGSTPSLIIDYDGRIARLVHRGVAIEAGLSYGVAAPDEAEIDRSLQLLRTTRCLSFGAIATNVIGLSVCTASGAASLRHIETANGLLFPVIDVSAARLLGPAPDRQHVAMDTLARLLAKLVLAQVELSANGRSYRPAMHGFPARLAAQAIELEAASETSRIRRNAFLKQ
jgi:S-adenosylhomocysteine hydrolase